MEPWLRNMTYGVPAHLKVTFPKSLAPLLCGKIGGFVASYENTCLPKFIEKLNTFYHTSVRPGNLQEDIWLSGIRYGEKSGRPVICMLSKFTESLFFVCLWRVKNVILIGENTKVYP